MRSHPSPEGKAPAKTQIGPIEMSTSLIQHESRTLRHELNNKLGIILAHCELMSLEASIDSATSKHLLEIRNAARSIADMIGIRGLSRPHSPKPQESK
jgi:hypothetical protein